MNTALYAVGVLVTLQGDLSLVVAVDGAWTSVMPLLKDLGVFWESTESLQPVRRRRRLRAHLILEMNAIKLAIELLTCPTKPRVFLRGDGWVVAMRAVRKHGGQP